MSQQECIVHPFHKLYKLHIRNGPTCAARPIQHYLNHCQCYVWVVLDAGIFSRKGNLVDGDGSLARQLASLEHHGDPAKQVYMVQPHVCKIAEDAQGVIWPRIAEISLLGALGCGRWLMRLIVEELETSSDYDFVVVNVSPHKWKF